jgi:hypothetical protein
VHRNQGAYALIIYEPIEIPVEKLVELAFKNMETVNISPVISEEGWKHVGSKKVRYTVYNATTDGIPFTYYHLYSSGRKGSVQFVMYTGANMFAEMKPQFEQLLDGFHLTLDE